ncbi:MAG: Uma2 family endonuclease [Candidatus Sumerlaeota bacterium]|nr:Uma2 family endonuclease [Candidatus Sumerlaeota bacterium]
MEALALKQDDGYTYGDYLQWPEDERWEMIDGIPFMMSPAPTSQHQGIAGELFRQFANFLLGKPCRVFHAPFDVRLPETDEPDEEIRDFVEPDLVVICDKKKIDDRGCRGVPDFVAEIVSPSTAARDQRDKTALYERHGVKEYWILHPSDNTLTVRLLGKNKRYGAPQILDGRGSARVATLPGLVIDLDLIFGRKAQSAGKPVRYPGKPVRTPGKPARQPGKSKGEHA